MLIYRNRAIRLGLLTSWFSPSCGRKGKGSVLTAKAERAQQFLWLVIGLTATLWITKPHAHWLSFDHRTTLVVGIIIVLISESWPLELELGSISLSSAGYMSVLLVSGVTEAFWVIVVGTILSWIRRFRGLTTVSTMAVMLLTLQAANALARTVTTNPVGQVLVFAASFLVVNHVIVNLYYLLRDGYLRGKEVTQSLFLDGLGWGLSLPLVAIYILLDRAYPHHWWVGLLGLLPYATVSLLLSFYYQTLTTQGRTRRTAQASESITAAMEKGQLAERVQSAFRDVLRYTLFVMYLWDPEGKVFHREAAVHPGDGEIPYPEFFIRGGEGLTDWALSTRTPEFVRNAADHPSASPSASDTHPLVSGFILPLMTDRKIWGFIVTGRNHPNHYSDYDFEMAKVLADHAAMAYRKWLLQEEAVTISRVDPLLPDVYNFRYFREVLQRRIGRYPDRPLALAFLDLDHFKQVNDRFGHMMGDEVLRIFSRMVRSELRPGDVLARYGGDEFVVLLDNVDADGVSRALARVQRRLESEHWVDVENPLGVSAGFGLYPEDGKTPEILLNVADLRMYQNKVARKSLRQNMVND